MEHYIDDKLGELLEVLEEQGLREDTVVIFTADHGEMLGEHGMIQKRSFYEWSTRIPLLIEMPGMPAGKVDVPVSLLDVPATLIDIAGQVPACPLDGRSLLPALNGGELAVAPIISEYHGEGIMRPSFMVRKGDWKYIYCHRAAPQLFNLADDPDEWRNRAGETEVAEIEAELKELLTGGRFDLERIEAEVWARLPMKQVVNSAMATNGTSWDYEVRQDSASRYVRT